MEPFGASSHENGNSKTDPDELCRLLDVTLANKRIAWKHAESQRQFLRGASFVFLLLVFAGALAAFCFVAFHSTEQRPRHSTPFSEK